MEDTEQPDLYAAVQSINVALSELTKAIAGLTRSVKNIEASVSKTAKNLDDVVVSTGGVILRKAVQIMPYE